VAHQCRPEGPLPWSLPLHGTAGYSPRHPIPRAGTRGCRKKFSGFPKKYRGPRGSRRFRSLSGANVFVACHILRTFHARFVFLGSKFSEIIFGNYIRKFCSE
jgi:hypothetical protein